MPEAGAKQLQRGDRDNGIDGQAARGLYGKVPLLPRMVPMVSTSQTPGMDSLVRSDPRSPVNPDLGLVTGPRSDSLAIGGHSGSCSDTGPRRRQIAL